jgi:hypothetical protein
MGGSNLMQTFKDSISGDVWQFEDSVTDIHALPNTPATLQPYVVPAPTAAELAAAAKAATNADAKLQLAAADAESVRAMREFILAKFGNDPLLNPVLAQKDAAVAAQRIRIK